MAPKTMDSEANDMASAGDAMNGMAITSPPKTVAATNGDAPKSSPTVATPPPVADTFETSRTFLYVVQRVDLVDPCSLVTWPIRSFSRNLKFSAGMKLAPL